MRMFVSIRPPSDVVAALDAFCEPRRDADDGWSWTRPEQWHCTLAFLAEVEPGHLERLTDALDEVAARTAPAELRLGGAGVFGHPDRAKVLYLGLDDPQGWLTGLARATRNAVQSAGLRFDGKPFTGHLTLARSQRGVSAVRWLRVFDAWEPMRWPVDRLELVSSEWTGQGRRTRHRVEQDWELRHNP